MELSEQIPIRLSVDPYDLNWVGALRSVGLGVVWRVGRRGVPGVARVLAVAMTRGSGANAYLIAECSV